MASPAAKRPLVESQNRDLPPVIVKLSGEGGRTFHSLTIPELREIAKSVSQLAGEVKSLRVARGGDLFVYVHTGEQIALLLQATLLGSKSVETSLPKQ